MLRFVRSSSKSSSQDSKKSSKSSKGKKPDEGPSEPAAQFSPDQSGYLVSPSAFIKKKKTPSPAASTTDIPKPPKKRSQHPRMRVHQSNTVMVTDEQWEAAMAVMVTPPDQEEEEEEPQEEEEEPQEEQEPEENPQPHPQVVIAVSAGHTVSHHSEHHSYHLFASPAYQADNEGGPDESVPMQQEPVNFMPADENLVEVPVTDPIAMLANDRRDPYVAAMLQGQYGQPVADSYSFPQLMRSNSLQNPTLPAYNDPFMSGMPSYPQQMYPPPAYQYHPSPPYHHSPPFYQSPPFHPQAMMPYQPNPYQYAPFSPGVDPSRMSYTGPSFPHPYLTHQNSAGSSMGSPVEISALREENRRLTESLREREKEQEEMTHAYKKAASIFGKMASIGRHKKR